MRNNLEQNDCVSVAQDEYNSLSVMHCRMTWQSPAANYMQQINHRFALLLIFSPLPPLFFFLVLPLSVTLLVRLWQSNAGIVTYSDGHLKKQIQIVSRK